MKWFTYCGSQRTDERYSSWSKSTSHRARYSWNRRKRDLALLLHSDDDDDPITEDDVQQLLKNELIQTLYPNGYYVLPGEEEGQVIISASPAYASHPDDATIETPRLKIVYDHERPAVEVDLRTVYNKCTSLVKAVGCEHCELVGTACLTKHVTNAEPVSVFQTTHDEDDYKEMFKNRVTKIGPFTYISPRLTIPELHYFVPSLRHPEHHDFTQIDVNSAAIGKRNKEVAKDLRFKRTHCRVCPLKGACHAYRSCRGPYPTAAEISKQIIAEYEDVLQNSSGFLPWQFWVVARAGNYRTKYERKEVVIHGMETATRYGRLQWRAVIYRAKSDLRRITEIDNYDELRKLFPNLPDEQTALAMPRIWGRPSNDVAVALYLRLLDYTHTRRSFRSGWGRTSYGILAKRLEDNCVRVTYCSERYERYATDIESFAQFFEQIDYKLGVAQKSINPDAYSND